MRLGLQLSNLTLPGGPAKLGENLANAARWAEEIGMDSVWVMDHFFQIEFIGPPEMDMLEGYTTLGYLAAVTKRVRLGTMVTGITYRHPGILAKTVTTLDVLSGGRAWFGVGAAWFEREHRGLGVRFPPLKERFEHLEEGLQIALQMWSSNNGPYVGKHARLDETLCVPQAAFEASSTDPDRRYGREEDAEAGGAICTGMQLLCRRRTSGAAAQARRAACALHPPRSQLR